MKIAILGCGALGSYYGARLCRAGQEVHFLLRSDYEAVSRDGSNPYCLISTDASEIWRIDGLR